MTIEAIPTRNHNLAGTSAVSAIPAIFRGIGKFFMAISEHAERRRADAELATMDPNMQRDIGVGQSDMMAVLYTPRRERGQFDVGF